MMLRRIMGDVMIDSMLDVTSGATGRATGHLARPFGHVPLAQTPLAHSGHDLTHRSQTGIGHLQRSAGRNRGDHIIRGAPIGNHHAVKTPLVAQHPPQQVAMLMRVRAVDPVI